MDKNMLKHGTPARLFPVVSEANKEQKTLSIVLATITSVRPFAERVFSQLGVKVGKRSNISIYTEVTLANEVKGLTDRPDALIVIESGRNSWTALVEAKVGKSSVEADQLSRYIELAKLNNVDAVITISNELTPAPTLNPTSLKRAMPKGISLFHLSWASVLTTSFLLAASKEDPFENDDEAFLISELIRYLEHSNSGLVPLAQMNKDWPQIVVDVQSRHPLNPKAEKIQQLIATWHQEARDVALIMTRKLKEAVSIATSRAHLNNPVVWFEHDSKSFCDEKKLSFELDVPNAASRMKVEADFQARAVHVSMRLDAPKDRKSNAARVNWFLRQLNSSDKSKVSVRCITKGKARNWGTKADQIDPQSEEIKNLAEISAFQVEMSSDLGARFNSRKRFVESLEEIVPQFYENVGQHLQAYVARPPKLKAKKDSVAEEDNTQEEVDPSASSEPEAAPVPQVDPRPVWTTQWQNESTSEENSQPDN